MLNERQRAIRATGIGASEVASIFEMNPYRQPIDVWLSKRGMVTTAPEIEIEGRLSKSKLGGLVEGALLDVYREVTRFSVRHMKHLTLRDRITPRVLASPDALGRREDIGCEIKIVGMRMAHHWQDGDEGETVPDYVELQCQQNMLVTGRAAWDVIALINGTDFRIRRVEANAELHAILREEITEWWARYVEGEEAPPIRSTDERKRYFAARYPGSEKTGCRAEDDADVGALVEYARQCAAQKRAWEAEYDAAKVELLGVVANDYGIEHPAWGKVIAPKTAGRTDWKAVAEEIAGGPIPTALIDKHRGDAHRSVRLYDPPAPKALRSRAKKPEAIATERIKVPLLETGRIDWQGVVESMPHVNTNPTAATSRRRRSA